MENYYKVYCGEHGHQFFINEGNEWTHIEETPSNGPNAFSLSDMDERPLCNHSFDIAADGWSKCVCLICKQEIHHPGGE